MSAKFINRVWRLENISATQKLLLLALSFAADKQGICCPSISWVSENTSLSDRAVRKNLKILERSGYITIENRQNKSNCFKLKF